MVRKPATPPSASIASARSACGSGTAASGVAWPALSMIGCTARSGRNCAEEPMAAMTAAQSPDSSRPSSTDFITS